MQASLNLLLQTMRGSETVEISEDNVKMRPREDPEKWPLTSQSILAISSLKVDVPEFVPGQAFTPAPAMANTESTKETGKNTHSLVCGVLENLESHGI